MYEVKQPLDIHNPSQFYGALGLLTLISLRQPACDLYSCFEILCHQGESNATFVISGDLDLQLEQVTSELTHAVATADTGANIWKNPKEKPELISPVILSSNGWSIVLDWWLDPLRYETNHALKLWAGNSKPVDMLKSFIKQGEGFARTGGTVFGFDTRTSRDSLSVGYSRKDTKEKAGSFPQAELLCAIGLQRYRPHNLTYYAWHRPVPLSITYVAAIQEIPGLPQSRFEFAVRKIGQGAKEVTPAQNTFSAASGSK